MYQEKVTVVLKKDWALKFYGALYHSMTPYDSEIEINFPKPVPLEPGKLFWIIVNFDKGGTYSFLKDVNKVYNSHNMEITFTDDLSAITEIFFFDNEQGGDGDIDGESMTSSPSPPGGILPSDMRAIAAPPSSSNASSEFSVSLSRGTPV